MIVPPSPATPFSLTGNRGSRRSTSARIELQRLGTDWVADGRTGRLSSDEKGMAFTFVTREQGEQHRSADPSGRDVRD